LLAEALLQSLNQVDDIAGVGRRRNHGGLLALLLHADEFAQRLFVAVAEFVRREGTLELRIDPFRDLDDLAIWRFGLTSGMESSAFSMFTASSRMRSEYATSPLPRGSCAINLSRICNGAGLRVGRNHAHAIVGFRIDEVERDFIGRRRCAIKRDWAAHQ